MVNHPATGGCPVAPIITNKCATDFMTVSVGEATDARHVPISIWWDEWYYQSTLYEFAVPNTEMLRCTPREAGSLPYRGVALYLAV